MISEFGKKMIASGIPENVVKRAYDFIEKSGVGEGLVGEDGSLYQTIKDFAATAYIAGAREQKEEMFKKIMEK